MSKAALDMLVVPDGTALGKQGVKVFAGCPGLVESNVRGEGGEEGSAGGKAGDAEVSGRRILQDLGGREGCGGGEGCE